MGSGLTEAGQGMPKLNKVENHKEDLPFSKVLRENLDQEVFEPAYCDGHRCKGSKGS